MTDYQELMNPYPYNNVLYINGFPLYWAMTHIPGTGPTNCQHCRHYGMVDNIFVGYCSNCCNIYNNNEPRGDGAPLHVPHYVSQELRPYILNTFYTYREQLNHFVNHNEIHNNTNQMNDNLNRINNNLIQY
jgi:hypothetical protein